MLRVTCAAAWSTAVVAAKGVKEKVVPAEERIEAAAGLLAEAASKHRGAENSYEAAKAHAHAESERLEAEMRVQLEEEERRRQEEEEAAEKEAAEAAERRQQEVGQGRWGGLGGGAQGLELGRTPPPPLRPLALLF